MNGLRKSDNRRSCLNNWWITISKIEYKEPWKQCPTCHLCHQGTCPCYKCGELAHVAVDCIVVGMEQWSGLPLERGQKGIRSPLKEKRHLSQNQTRCGAVNVECLTCLMSHVHTQMYQNLFGAHFVAKILRSRLSHNHRRFTLNDTMDQVVAMEGDYQAGELFTGDIRQIMGTEEEVNDVSVNDKTFSPRRSQSFNHCYKCSKTGHFQKDCPGDGDEENIEPQHGIIGTVTHTMEAQTPVTDKSSSDFMCKNFKQTEKLKKKYTATKSKLKRTKQELDEVKSKKYEPVNSTSENTPPKNSNSNFCQESDA